MRHQDATAHDDLRRALQFKFAEEIDFQQQVETCTTYERD